MDDERASMLPMIAAGERRIFKIIKTHSGADPHVWGGCRGGL